MANKKRAKAQRMASRGATAKEIRQATGIKAPAARNIVSRAAAPAPQQASPTPSRTTPKIKGVGQGLRISGGGGLSKGELKTISDVSGKDPGKIIGKLDKINEKLAGKDKTGITLKSGAANMLIRKASKSTPKSRGYKPVDFGAGPIGSALMGMMGDPGSPGTWIKGQKQGVREAVEPTFLAKGMDLGPKGRETVRGVGKQYELPKRFDPKEPKPDPDPTPTNTDPGTSTGGDLPPFVPPELPPEEEMDPGVGMMSGGGMGATGANKLGRAKSRLRKLGIYGRGTGLLGRGLQYGNSLNA
jgi:hypothetical protein